MCRSNYHAGRGNSLVAEFVCLHMRATTPRVLVRPLDRPTARPRVPPRQAGASMAALPDVTTVDEQWVTLAHALSDAAAVVTTKYFR